MLPAIRPCARAGAKFVGAGGMKGQIEIPGGANLRANAWTLELIMRVPSSPQASDERLLSWTAGNDITASLVLAQGSTVGSVVGQGTVPFRLSASFGGDGHTIQRDAADQWVYLAWGMEANSGRMCMIARCLDGHVLGSRVEFISPASFRLMDRTRKGNPANPAVHFARGQNPGFGKRREDLVGTP